MKKLAGIVAGTGLGLAVVLTLLAFCLVFTGFAEPFGSGSAEWLTHAGASCFALSRIGWVLAIVGGAVFAALTYPTKEREDAEASKKPNTQSGSHDFIDLRRASTAAG